MSPSMQQKITFLACKKTTGCFFYGDNWVFFMETTKTTGTTISLN